MSPMEKYIGKRVRASINDARFATEEYQVLDAVEMPDLNQTKLMDSLGGIFWMPTHKIKVLEILGPNTVNSVGCPLKLKNNPSKIKK